MQEKNYAKKLFSLLCLLGFAVPAMFGQGTLAGMVTNEKGEPLSGATITIGDSYGAYSEENGTYRITDIPDGEQKVVCTYYGYKDNEQIVVIVSGSEKLANFSMVEELASTNEVVVVGYGTMRRRDLTSSISKVTDVNDNVGNSFEVNLQGKASGVQVVQSSGAAGSGAVVRIRGINSISAGGDPLYVIDGIPITQEYNNSDSKLNNVGGQNNNPLATINPNDIESVEVLKDAAACGIYGSRGANGVILITTKKGKIGKPQFDFTSRVGVSMPTKLHEFMNNQEWLQMRQEAWENDGKTGRAPLPRGVSWEDALKTNTDWVDLTVGTGVKQEYNLGMKQGNKRYSSYLSAGYLNDESFLKGNSYVRYSARYNMEWKLADWFKLAANTSLAQGVNNRVSQAWDAGGFGAANSTLLPIYSPGDNGVGNLGGDDPVFRREHRKWKTNEWRSINGLIATVSPLKNLDITATGNYDYRNWDDNVYEDSTYDRTNHIARAERNRTQTYNRNGNITANYHFNLGENNSFTVLVGSEAQKSVTRGGRMKLENVDRPINLRPEFQSRTSARIDTTENSTFATQAWSFLSYFARVNYDYKKKYFIQGSIRRDASSRYGANYRWANLPTVGVAYVLSEEKFLKDSKVINFVKLKASWGLVGNSNIPNYERFGYYSPSTTSYNGQGYNYPVKLENPNLRWETTRTIDGGLEVGLWNDRIQFTVEAYQKNTKSLLVNGAIQQSSGFDKYWLNLDSQTNKGNIENKGIEFSITSHNIDNKKFKWTTILNIARNTNKVLDIGGAAPDALSGGTNDTRIIIGQPVGTHFRVRWAGVDPTDGLPMYYDINGNITKKWSEDDRVVVGSVLPKAVGGISNNFTIGNWDINTMFTFTLGGYLYDNSVKRQIGVVTDWTMRKELADRWRKPGDVATYPRLTMDPAKYGLPNEWQYNSTLWLYDGTFGRLKNVTVGYNVPMPSSAKVSSLRVYFIGTNLITLTKYPGMDPEVARDFENGQDRNMSVGVTYLTAPQARSFNLGVNLGF